MTLTKSSLKTLLLSLFILGARSAQAEERFVSYFDLGHGFTHDPYEKGNVVAELHRTPQEHGSIYPIRATSGLNINLGASGFVVPFSDLQAFAGANTNLQLDVSATMEFLQYGQPNDWPARAAIWVSCQTKEGNRTVGYRSPAYAEEDRSAVPNQWKTSSVSQRFSVPTGECKSDLQIKGTFSNDSDVKLIDFKVYVYAITPS